MHLSCMWSHCLSSSLRNLCWFVGLARVARIFFPHVDKCHQVALGSPAFSVCSYALLLQLRLNLQVVTNTLLFVKEILPRAAPFFLLQTCWGLKSGIGEGYRWALRRPERPSLVLNLRVSCLLQDPGLSGLQVSICRVNFSFMCY